MMWMLIAATLVLWLLVWLGGFAGHLVHLLLLVVLVLLLIQFISMRRAP
jgi:hypothetical protein